ncbi:hypothetical protein BO70DRAFT_359756 [Aspergillus heteromorphus CBS 117.55]|uniref:Uncharacterized protein n=1 Tax=Aspergillus heteromorphus CBS 117.55 TaxID=1448321 RepID=A0A317WPH1_9EURO|nr:uncharacterized protein BO70DRAFT_359756 [Aspergillus heteromorphus CBS 117.55]PWY88313.1 hypothetical protein BO70DRAFT_359756 [Aspergillus heteromorphus CBS 117.55]
MGLKKKTGPNRDSNAGPPAFKIWDPKAGIIPLDHPGIDDVSVCSIRQYKRGLQMLCGI